MYLRTDDIKKITEVLEKFPNVDMIELKQDISSGIGPHTTMHFDTAINGVAGRLEVVVSTVENW